MAASEAHCPGDRPSKSGMPAMIDVISMIFPSFEKYHLSLT
jgi:hypothetical protein